MVTPEPPSFEEVPSCFVQGEVVVLSVLLLQEMKVKLKRRKIEKRMSRCFTWFPISVLGEPNIYHDSGVFYKNVGILLGGCLTVKN